MSYHHYHTKAIVLKNSDVSEASRMYKLYTRELGLVHARAQGVRALRSKLRYNLEELAVVDVSLVRGKEFWRVTGAMFDKNAPASSKTPNRFLRARAAALLAQLVQGEEKNEELFDSVYTAFSFLEQSESENVSIADMEIALVLKILSSLGYLGRPNEFEPIISTPAWSQEMLKGVESVRKRAIYAINYAFSHTQL